MASTIRTMILQAAPYDNGGETAYAYRLPVSLRGASEKKDVNFDRATKDGNPIKRIETDAVTGAVEVEVEVRRNVPLTGRQKIPRTEVVKETKIAYLPIEDDGVVKGVREGEEFYPIQPEEIAQIEELTKLDSLTIEEFIPADDVPWYRAQACYFLAPPKGVGAKALATLRDAMTNQGVVGVAKLMPKSRQKLALVYPKHGGLMVTCIAYSDTFAQVIEGAAAISGVEVNPKMLELTEKLIEATTAEVSVLDEYRDDVIDTRAALIERAKLGQPLTEKVEGEVEAPVPAKTMADLSSDTLIAKLNESLQMASAKPSARKSPSREKAAV